MLVVLKVSKLSKVMLMDVSVVENTQGDFVLQRLAESTNVLEIRDYTCAYYVFVTHSTLASKLFFLAVQGSGALLSSNLEGALYKSP